MCLKGYFGYRLEYGLYGAWAIRVGGLVFRDEAIYR